MAKTDYIELPSGERIPILYEDRAVLAIDKPAGWMLVPTQWRQTSRNLQVAIESSIAARDFWARSRSLRFLRFVHRLDAETTGVLLFVKSLGAMRAYSTLFASGRIEKTYLAVVEGVPQRREWVCRLKLAPDSAQRGKAKVGSRDGREAETRFRVLGEGGEADRIFTLVEARPMTGRTHQVRVHLAAGGHPVVGDALYGTPHSGGGPGRAMFPLGLRAVSLKYEEPFRRQWVCIEAPAGQFLAAFGFGAPSWQRAGGGWRAGI